VKPAQQQRDDSADAVPNEGASQVPRPPSAQPDQAGPDRFTIIIGTVIGLALIALLAVLRLSTGKAPRLGSDERARLLGELQSWVHQSPPGGKRAAR
jgi:hypothetical protein